MNEEERTRLVGELRAERLACDSQHLPGCYNPWLDKTWCICGTETWSGDVGSWHCVPRYDSCGEGAKRIGWDTYFLSSTAE